MNDKKFEKKFRALERRLKRQLKRAPGCHDYDHTCRVLTNAVTLAEQLPEADLQVVRMAALLHDCARTEELSTKGKRCHARLGAALAKTWLEEEGGFEPDFIKQVANAVRTHRYRSGKLPDTLEGEIVYDADKLDSLGAIGIGRAFLFAGREGARVHNSAREALHGRAYGPEDTAYREYLVKLRQLPEALRTEPGRELAARRAEFMRAFFDELNRETGLEQESC